MRFYISAVIAIPVLMTPMIDVGADADFKVLKEEECKSVNSSDVNKLPQYFSKYMNRTKICPLSKGKGTKAVVYIRRSTTQAQVETIPIVQ